MNDPHRDTIPLPPHTAARQSSDAEIDAFYDLCERMRGFEGVRPPAAVDGFLTALAVGPVRLAPEQ